MGADHILGGAFDAVNQLYLVVAAFTEQAGNQRADLAGAEDQDVLHGYSSE